MNPTRICFIRHGETDWNVDRRIQGQIDIPLNDTGRSQALAMAFNAAHHSFADIYSSDLMRAQETAKLLAEREGLEVKPLPQLRERHYGIFEGLIKDELHKHPDPYAKYQARDLEYDFENGETIPALAARVEAAVDFMVSHHSGEMIAAVTHAGVLDILYRRATGRPLNTPRDFIIPNCALNWFMFDNHGPGGKGWHLEAWDDHHHLAHVLKDSVE